MKTIVVVISLIGFFVVGFIASFKGLDLRKFSYCLYGAISFLSGFAFGFSLSGNLNEGLRAGVIFMFLTLVGGATMLRHKQKYNENMARSLLLKYGKENDSSFFAKLVRRLLNKYR